MLLFRKLCGYSLILSLVFNNLAFATQSIIELDFKDSQTPQRLHVIPRLSNVGDVSHLEIDAEEKQVAVYRNEKQEEALNEIEKHSSQGGDVHVITKPVILQKHDIINLPWDLEPEKLTLFILNHNAWLSPLEDDYKLEFKSGLLGGGGGQSTGGGGGGKKELVIEVTKFTVDCKGRNDYPSGTIGERFCNKNGNGSGNFGIPVINKPYVPTVDKEWQNHCEKINNNPFRNQKAPYIHPIADKNPDLKKANVNPVKASVIKIDDKKIHQSVAKDVGKVMQPLINRRREEFRPVLQKMPIIIMEELAPYQGGELPKKTLDDIISNVSWKIDGLLKDTKSFKLYWQDGTIKLENGRWWPSIIDPMSRTGVLSAYEGLKKQYADELEEIEKKQKLEEKEREKARQYERDSSLAGSSLFKNVPPQYQVTPEYFKQSASDAGLMPSEALHIILNPTSENFYHRTILTSRQEWLGGAKNTIAFGFEDLTNEQAYKYISQGYKFGDFPTLSDRLVCQRGSSLFKDVTSEYFSKQAEKAKMTSMQALKMIFIPTPENFYDRVILVSRQEWLGGRQDKTVFNIEDLTNEQAYQYISDGYKPHDFPTLSNKLVSQRGATLFENVTSYYFFNQAEKAGMTPMKALAILTIPTLENAYERVLLASRQNYLGGTHDLFVFRDMGITVGEAYDHLLTHIKNNENFSQLVDDNTNKAIKEGFIQFCRESYQDRYGSFYDEYEKVKHLQYLINTTAWEGVYNYAETEGFSKEDVQYVESRRKENITFDNYMKEKFDDQVLEDWEAKDWRELFSSTEDDAEFIQVGLKEFDPRVIILKKIAENKFAKDGIKKGVKFVRDAWQKAVQAYKGEIVKGLKIDKSVENKLTQELGKPKLVNKDIGLRWEAPKGNGIRIMKGRKDANFECQRNDYVQVRRGGQVIGRNQKEVKPTTEFPRPSDNKEAHIPYEEWINWSKLLGE